MNALRTLLATILALAAAGAAFAQARPDDYALKLPITTTASAALQRVALPTQALVAARSPGLADVRVFDADGRAAPIALLPSGGWRQSETRLQPLPLMGPAETPATGGLRVAVDGTSARVTVDGAAPAAAGGVIGALFDVRKVDEPAVGLLVDLELPSMQLVTVFVESSQDLRYWRPEGSRTMYGGLTPSVGPVALPGAVLKGRYLKVTWTAQGAVAGQVVVRGATLTTSRWAPSGAAPMVRLITPRIDGRALIFTAPPAAPAAELRIRPPARAAVLTPVRLFARSNPEGPWTLIGSTVVRSLGSEGAEEPAVSLDGRTFAELKIEADERGSPLGADSEVELRLQPAEVVFVAGGRAPYTLAIGRAGGAAVYLPPEAVAPEGRAGGSIPSATVAGVGEVVTYEAEEGAGKPARRDLVLWGVLIAATVALGGMVAALWRGQRRRDAAM